MNNVRVSCTFCGVSKADHAAEIERLSKERDEVLDILWRDIDDLRDPKLTVVQVAAKVANAIHWRNKSLEAAESKLSQLQLELIAERDREWCVALCGIDVAASATSVRGGEIKLNPDNEDKAERLIDAFILTDDPNSEIFKTEILAILNGGQQ